MSTALFCTHKRGVGLALLPGNPPVEVLQQAIEHSKRFDPAQAERFALPHSTSEALVHVSDLFLFATSAGLTAENLAPLYALALARQRLTDLQVDSLAVVAGPGSFTGLRLGCAFANGLCVGRPRTLIALDLTSSNTIIDDLRTQSSQDLPEEFFGVPSPDADDPFATAMCPADIYCALVQWSSGAAQLVDVLEPHYGREPTPVLKLKQQQGSPVT